MSVRRDFPDIPPIWALGVATLQWLAALLVPLWRFEAGWLGGLLALTGLALGVWAGLWFARKRTTIEPRDTPTTLIVEGPFRINRNPIYTGGALMLLGWGIWLGALSAVFLAFAFPPVITRRFIRGEEADLRAAFGAEADTYIAATRRW